MEQTCRQKISRKFHFQRCLSLRCVHVLKSHSPVLDHETQCQEEHSNIGHEIIRCSITEFTGEPTLVTQDTALAQGLGDTTTPFTCSSQRPLKEQDPVWSPKQSLHLIHLLGQQLLV